MPRPLELDGERYGRLLVLHRMPGGKWLVACDCGRQTVTHTQSLRSGKTRSCGCLRDELVLGNKHAIKHGHYATATHAAWRGMRNRCVASNKDYGGRGIAVCERWQTFENFLADMGKKPVGLTLERNDVNGNYEPSNCRWATPREQERNKRTTLRLTHGGETLCLSEWAERLGALVTTLWKRHRKGWPVERVLTQPVRKWVAK